MQNLDGKLSLSPAGQKWGFEGETIQYSTENQTQVPQLGEQSMGQPVKRSIDESSSRHFQDSFFCEIPGKWKMFFFIGKFMRAIGLILQMFILLLVKTIIIIFLNWKS